MNNTCFVFGWVFNYINSTKREFVLIGYNIPNIYRRNITQKNQLDELNSYKGEKLTYLKGLYQQSSGLYMKPTTIASY